MPRSRRRTSVAVPRHAHIDPVVEALAAGLARLIEASAPPREVPPDSRATCLEFSAESRLSGPTGEPAREAGDVETRARRR
jgi:hypothetical protein